MTTAAGEEPLLRLHLEPDARAAGLARRAVRGLVVDGRPDLLDDAATVLSELVTNAVVHGRGELRVTVAAEPGGLRVEVHQGSDGPWAFPPPLADGGDDEPATTGRGLAVVGALADAWGARPEPDGTVVWALLGTAAVPGSGAAPVTAAQAPPGGAGASAAASGRRAAQAPWAVSLRTAAELAGGRLVPARLLALPVRLLTASARQFDDLLRELRLLAGTGAELAAALGELEEPARRLALSMRVLREATARAIAVGARLVDVDLPLQRRDPAALHELLDLLERLAGDPGRLALLTLPATPEVAAFRRWVAAELHRQVEGDPAVPCPFPVTPLPDGEVDAAGDGDPLLRRLQQVGAALAGVDSAEALNDVVLRDLSEVSGAVLTALWLREPDGSIAMRAAPGALTDDIAQRWSRVPSSTDVPVAEVSRTGRAAFFADDRELVTAHPMLQGSERLKTEATAVLPLRVADGRLLGSLLLSFAEPRAWSQQERTVLSLLADAVAQALERTRLREEERSSARRLELLARAGQALTASLEPEATALALAELVVPELADVAAVHVCRGRELVPLAFAAVEPAARVAVEQLARRWPSPLDPSSALGRAALEGVVEQWQHIPDELLRASAESEEHYLLLRELNLGAGLAVPLRTGSRVLGVLAAIRRPGWPLRQSDLDLALALSGPAASALENAERYDRERARAVALQETLLPPVLPRVEGLDLGVAYSAAGGGEQVGGDFYDALEVSGSLVLAIGDVRGRGVEAAALTGLARHTIRALAWREMPPAGVLRELDRALQLEGRGRDEPAFCTAALGVVTRADGGGARLRLASGGHPAPFVLRASGRVERLDCPGDLLGLLDEPQLAEVELALGPGDAVVLVTDGVLERRGTDGLFDDAGVVGVLSAAAGATAQELAARLAQAVRDFGPAPAVDDLAILAVRVPRQAAAGGHARP